MKILITGGAGYIGSAVAKKLSKNHYVEMVDNLSNSYKPAGNFFKRDIRNEINMRGVDVVIHCAAISDILSCKVVPSMCYNTNVGGTMNILTQANLSGVRKIIFASTCAVNEDHPYAKSKKMAEEIIKDSGFNYSILRLHNVAGADGDIGENRKSETHLIPKAISKIEHGAPFILDGDFIRDYVHINDVADAFERELTTFKNIEHIGSGKGYSTKEILKKIEELSGKKLLVVNTTEREKVSVKSVAEEPYKHLKHSDIDNIIKSAIDFYRRKNDTVSNKKSRVGA